MLDIVFVHGTGVREPAYSRAFSIVSKNLKERGDLRIHKCYWGGPHGTTLNAGGQSIPDFDTNRALGGEPSDKEFTIALWELLYQDPLFELQILALRPGRSESIPGRKPLGQDLDNRVKALTPSSSLREMLERVGLGDVFEQARTTVVGDRDYQAAIAAVREPLGEYRLAIARSLVAQSVVLMRFEYGDLAFSLNAEQRDWLVEQVVAELGGTERGLSSWVKDNLSGLAKRIATNNLQRRRGRISADISGGGGDILMYQVRGQKIRDFIRATIAPLPGPVVVIAHSLGGIACVDLLLEKQPPQDLLLVTVGSQAPLLYELNALVGREYDSNWTLPPDFPRWLNIYDKRDFLSYIGADIFPGRVKDVEVDSGQPFPESHGAYWTNKHVWDAIWETIQRWLNPPQHMLC